MSDLQEILGCIAAQDIPAAAKHLSGVKDELRLIRLNLPAYDQRSYDSVRIGPSWTYLPS